MPPMPAAPRPQRSNTRRPGSATPWRNPDSGSYGTVTPVHTYETAGGYCREFQHKAKIGGRDRAGLRHRLPQPDGAWQVVN